MLGPQHIDTPSAYNLTYRPMRLRQEYLLLVLVALLAAIVSYGGMLLVGGYVSEQAKVYNAVETL